jgi:polyhydroxyalkanoate synthesis repressor PhaR
VKQQGDAHAGEDVVVIRRYGNRRLYDTRSSVYVNLADVMALVRDGKKIRVVDATTEEDVTRRVLTQIVLESADEKGLPLDLLYELARASDRAFRDFLDWYLKSSMEVYQRLQESWQIDARRRWGDSRPALEAWAQLWDPRQVAASLAQLLSPFDRRGPAPGAPGKPGPGPSGTAEAATGHSGPAAASATSSPGSSPRGPDPAAAAETGGSGSGDSGSSAEIDELRRRLDELERRLGAGREGSAHEPPRS